jgi:HSP20 family protein
MATGMTHWRPFAEMEDLRKRMDRMFEDMGNGRAREWNPAVDLLDRDDHYVVRANVPGITPEEVKIEVEDDVLTISAEHDERKAVTITPKAD